MPVSLTVTNAVAVIGGKRCILLKPQTYMNLSGESVSAVANYYKIEAQDIIVIYDDINLDVGRLRIREKGSAGGLRFRICLAGGGRRKTENHPDGQSGHPAAAGPSAAFGTGRLGTRLLSKTL